MNLYVVHLKLINQLDLNKYVHIYSPTIQRDFTGGSVGKISACNARDTGDFGSIPGLGRSPGGGRTNSLQYSCLENPTDREAWQATVHGIAKESGMI